MDFNEKNYSELLEQLDILYEQKEYFSNKHDEIYERYYDLGKKIKETYDEIEQIPVEKEVFVDKKIGELKKSINKISQITSIIFLNISIFVSFVLFSLTNISNIFVLFELLLILVADCTVAYGIFKITDFFGKKVLSKKLNQIMNSEDYLKYEKKNTNLHNEILNLSQIESLITANLKDIDVQKRKIFLDIKTIEELLKNFDEKLELKSISPKQN